MSSQSALLKLSEQRYISVRQTSRDMAHLSLKPSDSRSPKTFTKKKLTGFLCGALLFPFLILVKSKVASTIFLSTSETTSGLTSADELISSHQRGTDKLKSTTVKNRFDCQGKPCGECFPTGVVPIVKYIETTGDYHVTACPDYFITTLMQAVTANGVGNVVLLEVGSVCKNVSTNLGVRHYSLSTECSSAWRRKVSGLPFNHTWERLLEREPGWTGENPAAYYSSYYRIYAIYDWVEQRPCIDRVTHMDVDSITYQSSAEVLRYFPRHEFIGHMAWPTNANHIYTSFTRGALQDFIAFCDAGFRDPVTLGHHEHGGWGYEFTSDMHALASYFAYNITQYPCWSFAKPSRAFGQCSDFYNISFAGFRTPFVRPSHVPRYPTETVAFPRCNLEGECGFFSEGLNQNKDQLSTAFVDKHEDGSWIQVRWIKCQPYVLRLNPVNGKYHWVHMWGFHGQGVMKGFLQNYWRPSLHLKECQEEDCLCADHFCKNCFAPFQSLHNSAVQQAAIGNMDLSILRADFLKSFTRTSSRFLRSRMES